MSLATVGASIGAAIGAAKAFFQGADIAEGAVKVGNTAAGFGSTADMLMKKHGFKLGYGPENSLTALIDKYIIEPTIFVSKDVAASCPDVKDKAICECIDLFTTLWSQSFHIMVNIEGTDHNLAIRLLGTSSKNYEAVDIVTQTAFDVAGDAAGRYINSQRKVPYRDRSTVGKLATKLDTSLSMNDGTTVDMAIKKGFSDLKKVYDKVGMESMDLNICDLKNKTFLTFEPNANNVEVGLEDAKVVYPKDGSKFCVQLPKDQIHMGFHIRNFEVVINKPIGDSYVSIKIPFIVRANIVELNVEHMCYGIQPKTSDKKFWKRWHQYKAGAISFWKDLVFCSDLIEQNRKDRVKDKSGAGKQIDYAKYNSRMSGRDIEQATMERFYNMFVVTPSDMNKIYQVERGDIHNLTYKEQLFENLNALMLLCLDPEWEMGELFLKDLRGVSTIKFENIGKRRNNGLDGDLNSLFKTLYANNPPAF